MSALDELYRGIDGDTFVLTDESGEETRIRAGGYDAPETGKYKSDEFVYQNEEPGAQLAKQALDALYQEADFEIEPTGEKTYNRQVANLTANGQDVGELFIGQGLAHPTRWSTQEQHSAAAVPAIRSAAADAGGPLEALYTEAEWGIYDQLQASKEATPYQFSPGMATPRAAGDDGNAFTNAFGRGADNLHATLYAAVNAIGEATGIDAVSEWGEEGMLRNLREAAENPPEVASYEDIDSLSSFGTYVAEALGEQGPNLLAMLTGAGISAVAGRAVLGKALLSKAAQTSMKRELAERAAVGAFGTSYAMGTGEIQMELKEGGIDSPGTALGMAIPFAALDTAGAGMLLGTFFKDMKRDASKHLVRQALEGFAKRGALGAMSEAPTEALQEVISLASRAMHDPEFEMFSDENVQRIKEAAVKAAVVGGTIGGAGGVYSGLTAESDPNAPENFRLTPDDGAVSESTPEFELDGTPDVDPRQMDLDLRQAEPAAPDNQMGFTFDEQIPEAATDTARAAGQPQVVGGAPQSPLGNANAQAADAAAQLAAQGVVDAPTAQGAQSAVVELIRGTTNKPSTLAKKLSKEQKAELKALYPEAKTFAQRVELARASAQSEAANGQAAEKPNIEVAETPNIEVNTPPVREKSAPTPQPTPQISRESAEISRGGNEVLRSEEQNAGYDEAVATKDVEVGTDTYDGGSRISYAGKERSDTVLRKVARVIGLSPTDVVGDPTSAELNIPDSLESGADADSRSVAEQLVRVLDSGARNKQMRLEIANPEDWGGKGSTRVNSMEIANLGALVDESTRDSELSAVKRVARQFTAGMSYLAERGFGYPSIDPDTPIYKFGNGGEVLTYGDVFKAAKGTKNKETLFHERRAERLREIPEDLKALEEIKKTAGPEELATLAGEEAALYAELDYLNEAPSATDDVLSAERREALIEEDYDNDVFEGEGAFVANPIETDNRQFEPEKNQARRSSKTRGNKQQASDAPKRRGVTRGYGSNTISDDEINYIRELKKLLGISQDIVVMDEIGVANAIASLESYIARLKTEHLKASVEGRNAQAAEILDRISTYRSRVSAYKDILKRVPDGRILYNDHFDKAEDRVPVIFINSKMKAQRGYDSRTKRPWVITHEFGHLVQRTSLDQLVAISKDGGYLDRMEGVSTEHRQMLARAKEIIEEFRQVAKEQKSDKNFEEWFANQMYYYAMTSKPAKTLIGKFFKFIASRLRQLFMKAKHSYPAPHATFKNFMDAMVGAQELKSGKPSTRFGAALDRSIMLELTGGARMAKRGGARHSADFTFDDLKDAAKRHVGKARATRLGKHAEGVSKSTWDVLKMMGTISVQPNDSFLRALGLEKLADHFHIRPDATRKRAIDRNNPYGGMTVFQELNSFVGETHATMVKAIETINKIAPSPDHWYDRFLGKRANKEHPKYKAMVDALVGAAELDTISDPEVREAVKAVREHFDMVYEKLESMGIDIKKRSNYFPMVFNTHKILSNEAEFKAALRVEIEKDIAKLTNGKLQARVGAIAKSISNEEWLEGKRPPAATKEALTDYVVNHIFEGIRKSEHGVIDDLNNNPTDFDTIFGPSFGHLSSRTLDRKVFKAVQDYLITDPQNVMAYYTHAAARRGVMQRRFQTKTEHNGKTIINPMGKIEEFIKEAGLSNEHRQRVWKIMEGYMGRLGADMPHLARSFSGLMIMYQNLRLLSMALLTSLVDVGHIAYRGGFSKFHSGLGDMLKGKSRAELTALAKDLGVIRDDLTDHVLNDQMSQQLLNEQFTKANEMFFRAIGMHQWTNFTRVFALSAGRQFIHAHAKGAMDGDAKSIAYMRELGLGKEDWAEAAKTVHGKPDASSWSPKLRGAMHQFIDESIMRPDASKRPLWGSDLRFAVFFHLKSFMFDYHETILRRVWSQVSAKDAKVLERAMPILGLALVTLPIAAVGWELRKLIGNMGYQPYQGTTGEYLFEVIQRAGLPGVAQLFIDADESEDFGRFSVLSPMGPTVGQIEEFFTKDFDYFALRAVPGLAQAPAARRWIGEQLGE